MDPKTKEVFNGKALIDRLLVYFSKFGGSREKAIRYAQKLLDLGHIESLTKSSDFEDSSHVYRWTDVASVVNKARAKASDVENDEILNGKLLSFESSPSSSISGKQNGGRPTVRISIETDNCDGAEIQAHIRTHPLGSSSSNTSSILSSKTGDTISQAGMRTGKVISFVTETSKTAEVLRLVPVPSTLYRGETLRSDSDLVDETSTESKCLANEISYKPQSIISNEMEKKEILKHCSAKHDEDEEDKSALEESQDDSGIVTPGTPGPGASSAALVVENRENNTSGDLEKYILNRTSHRRKENSQDSKRSPENVKPKSSTLKYKWSSYENSENVEEYKENSRYSVRQPSPDKNEEIRRNVPKPHPRESSPHIGRSNLISASGRSVTSSASGHEDSESDCHFQSNSPKLHPRKLKFANEKDLMRMRNEYLENEEIRAATQQNNTGAMRGVDSAGMSLHSSGQDHDMDMPNGRHPTKIEQIPENDCKYNGGTPQTIQDQRDVKVLHHIPSTSPVNNLTSPPSSPLQRSTNSVTEVGLKSLFWTKIVCDPGSTNNCEGVFWMNVEKKIDFDEMEFRKLFRKPPSPSPQQKKSKGKVSPHQYGDGKTLKVLGMERSRQVGIRASSVRLPLEEIHDAIVNMDDSLLDCDALEALYDVRPTPQELDDIADALKQHPNGILDKPEQFVLMMAMIANVDERLKSWIFAKKFSDKVLDVKEQLNSLSNACIQVVRNTPFQALLEMILNLGNILNKGTQRGGADGYQLDILPKLKDVKSQNGETNLLQYAVKWFREKEKMGASPEDEKEDEAEEYSCKLPDQALLQKACAVTLQDVLDEIEALSAELCQCKDQLIPAVIEGGTCIADIKPYNERMNEFLEQAEKTIEELQALSAETTEITEEFKSYYVPKEEKTESLASILKHIEKVCEDFRMYWHMEERNAAKEAIFNMEKARRRRVNAVRVMDSPSALKTRFLEKRNRERFSSGSRSGSSQRETPFSKETQYCRPRKHETSKTPEITGRRPPERRDNRPNEKCLEEVETPHGASTRWNGTRELKHEKREAATPNYGLDKESRSDSRRKTRDDGPIRGIHYPNGGARDLGHSKRDAQLENYLGRARKNSTEIEKRLESLKTPQKHPKEKELADGGGMSRMKKAMMQRRVMLKAKTC